MIEDSENANLVVPDEQEEQESDQENDQQTTITTSYVLAEDQSSIVFDRRCERKSPSVIVCPLNHDMPPLIHLPRPTRTTSTWSQSLWSSASTPSPMHSSDSVATSTDEKPLRYLSNWYERIRSPLSGGYGTR